MNLAVQVLGGERFSSFGVAAVVGPKVSAALHYEYQIPLLLHYTAKSGRICALGSPDKPCWFTEPSRSSLHLCSYYFRDG